MASDGFLTTWNSKESHPAALNRGVRYMGCIKHRYLLVIAGLLGNLQMVSIPYLREPTYLVTNISPLLLYNASTRHM